MRYEWEQSEHIHLPFGHCSMYGHPTAETLPEHHPKTA